MAVENGRKRLYIRTFGCQMNVHDSEQMAVLLEDAGFTRTDQVETADLVIINTCSVREKAEQKAHSYLGRLRRLKRRNPSLIIGIAGCLAQQWGGDFLEKAPHLDFVLGTHNIHALSEVVDEIQGTGRRVVRTDFQEQVTSIGIPVPARREQVSAYVTIMQGCNNFCSYCIVPYVRGREQSRSDGDIMEEIRMLAEGGIREVTLLGQNVNSYCSNGSGNPDFPELLHEVNDVEGIERIRFTTSHPKDLSEELMQCFRTVDKLCEHIHLPLQSGSDEVLTRMNRNYSAGTYLEKVARLRDICPDISVSTDLIVGFPGESEADFQKTIDVMEKVRFDNAFSFAYSDRPGIASETYGDKVEDGVKRDRLRRLQMLQECHTMERNHGLVGRVEEILIEGVSRNSPNDITGRTRTNKIVNVPGDIELTGTIISVRITGAYAHSLRGEALDEREVRGCLFR
ncbi:MAG: tRNA (N6-isopentenyl adenosine(37)-C2)-methylthiotransferase MiaB [Deltaproteobacteria bacterium]|nr:tRNA (N6-isopentenyl adenosine(37)-C2)-methylthiotransferase MiaB [Deltaproteobacteria bacterium]